MKQMQKTAAARAATKRIRLAMPPEERRKLALRLFAILSGKRSQESYRRRGVDPFAFARLTRWPKRPTESDPHNVRATSKVNVNW